MFNSSAMVCKVAPMAWLLCIDPEPLLERYSTPPRLGCATAFGSVLGHCLPPAVDGRRIVDVDPFTRTGDGEPDVAGLGFGPEPVGRLRPGVQGEVERAPVQRDEQVGPDVEVGLG